MEVFETVTILKVKFKYLIFNYFKFKFSYLIYIYIYVQKFINVVTLLIVYSKSLNLKVFMIEKKRSTDSQKSTKEKNYNLL